jgi:DNA-binding LacI/PurR family transcriptional regulator
MADRGFLQSLREAGLPCVVAGSLVRPLPIDSVTADYAGGMQQAVTHLAQSGRRAIGLVNGPEVTTSSAEKYKGFRLALALHDLPFTPQQVVVANITPDDGYAGTRQLLQQMPGIDAIAFANDNMAMGGLSALKAMGRQVPGDVAVTGFHDYPVSRFTDPPLTTVNTNMHLIGTIAARRLCMLLADPIDEAWTILVPTELQIRGST